MRNSGVFAGAALAILTTMTIGCSVAVDKAKDGGDNKVKIDTPLGGIHVSSDDTTAADVGLPVYPGAHLQTKKDGDKSADIHLGFGEWQFRLKVVKYQSSASADQVLAFYKKALGRYGDVVQCSGQSAVGSPAATREGLTCDDTGKNTDANFKLDSSQSLKAGSKRHQHIVGIEKNDGPDNVFSLVEMDLPANIDGDKPETN